MAETDKRAEGLLEELSQLEKRRENWEGTWSEIQANVVPRRTGFDTDRPEKGERHDSQMYDGTPTSALNLMAQSMQGYLLSPSYKWAGLRTIIEPLMRNRDVRLWLNQVDDILFSLLARSNFYREMHEYFLDAGSFGTATLYTAEDIADQRLWFSVRHPREIYISENENEVVDTVFRRTEMSYKQMVESFGEENVHEDVLKQMNDNKYDTTLVLHAVMPNENHNPNKEDDLSQKFISWYVDIENIMVMRTKGYHENPYAVWRFYKNSDEEYGRSPSWDALPDILSIHQYAKTNINSAQMLTNPPLDIPEERKGELLYKPGAHNFYESVDREVKLMPSAPGYYIGVDREMQVREAIERSFFVPFFLMMANAEKEMTATEIMRRQEEKAVILGPMITGLNHDALDPMFDRIFGIAYRARWLPPAPPVLLRYGGKLEIDYMGPLAQAQRRHFQSEPFRSGMAELAGVAQFNPRIVDNFNWDYVAREIVRANGWPEESLHSERVVAQVRQVRQQMEQQARQAELMESAGKSLPALNEEVKPGTMLENIATSGVLGG